MLTLGDYAKIAGRANDPLYKGFVEDLLRYSDLMAVVPFETVDGLQVTGDRWQTLPGAAFRKLNAGYTESTGTTENVTETMVPLGGDVYIDRVLTLVGNVRKNPLDQQMAMKASAVALQFNYSMVAGDQAVNPDEFEGLKKRVANMPGRMTIWLDANADGTGASLKVLADSANRQKLLDAIHEAVKYSNATHLLMNEKSYLGVGKILRRESILDTTQDNYGRLWDALSIGSRKLPLVDVGLKSDKTTEIITNTETCAAADCSSIYAVRFDTRDGVCGLQLKNTSPKPYDPLNGREMEGKPSYIRRVDWVVGMFNLSQYCIARIGGFKMAAS